MDYNDPAKLEQVVEVLDEYLALYPRSNTPLRIILKCAPADSPLFKERLIQYVRP